MSTATAYLESRAQFGIKFGLETIRALVEALSHPQRRFSVLLVAGTNGKGSVVAYVDAALRASGLRVGRYTSPHLVHVHERIAVGGVEIGADALDSVVDRVREAAEAISAHPTYFETLTAAAFEHFRREGVGVAVLEVGMGGRLDATNVTEPVASAIVSVDLDHQAYLGSTVAAIAGEKAGVLRAGRATVLGPLAPEARAVVAQRAEAVGARLVDALAGVEVRAGGDALDVRTAAADYHGLRPLPGAHQRDNVVVALRLLEEARTAGLDVDLSRVPRAITGANWPGRLEWIPGDPPLLLDGAHNPAGAAALAAYLRSTGPFILLFGVMADKDVGAIARILFPLADEIVITQPRVKRAATPEAIAERAGGLAPRAYQEADAVRALALARRIAKGRTVVVAGSLYLVGEVKTLLAAGVTPRTAP